MALLNVDGIDVRRGQAPVLRNVSLQVEEQTVVAVIGSNGVGKSTCLRTISGLHRPRSGTISFDGREIGGASAREIVRLGISHVPEGRQLFGNMTVKENLEMGAYHRRRVQMKDITAVVDLLPAVGAFMNRRAGSLSGGQQQMAAIARGIMSKPSLLMLDEPSLGLAPLAVVAIREIVERLRMEGVTVLLVEQNASLALGVADHGYLLVNGEIRLHGTAGELRESEAVQKLYLGI